MTIAVVLPIIIVGATFGVVIFFIIKSIIAPKRVAQLGDLLKQGKSTAVIRAARAIIAKDPRNSEAHYLLGKALQIENKIELALMEYKAVNQISVFHGFCQEKEFRETVAALYEHFNQTEEALKEYLLLIRIQENNPDYYYAAGYLFEQRSKSEKALEYYRKTIELSPRHSDAHYRLGYILYRSKKPVEAKMEMETALKFQPDNYKAHFYLGKLLKESHDYVPALLAFEKAQKDTDFKLKALVERGGCYMSMNNFEKAIGELERAVNLSKGEASTEALYGRYFLSLCYEHNREIDKALEQWEFIYAKKPTFRDVAEKLSHYQDLRGDDRMKDYLTANMEDFYLICQELTTVIGLRARDVSDIPNGCSIIAVEDDSRWRNVRKMPRLIHFLRIPEMISESTIRNFHEKMKKLSVQRGVIVTSSNFSRVAMDFAESRPVELIGKDKLQDLLQKIELPAAPKRR